MTLYIYLKIFIWAKCQWLTPVILTTQEAKISKITVQSQPGQIAPKTLFKKKNFHRKGLLKWLKV
jgi:hypothetical protein